MFVWGLFGFDFVVVDLFETESLHSPGYPGIHNVDQVCLPNSGIKGVCPHAQHALALDVQGCAVAMAASVAALIMKSNNCLFSCFLFFKSNPH